ncbi:unnamed protein product [Symbiodinium natans]|uniref:Uncharacterized protein n=1 Tax=Symbiodinium natans TaxID=878477 RepID=A0A812NLH7_9DINO|nr:unnamed protein product [Symbiodinium natans]
MAILFGDQHRLYSQYEALVTSGLQILPILLIPALLTNIQRAANFQESPWSGAYVTSKYSTEVQEKVMKVVMTRRKQFGRALADSSSFMCLLYFLFVWAQAARTSPADVADFDRLLLPVHLVVMYLCALFQGGFIEFSDLSNTWLGIVLNATMIVGQFCINSWSDAVAYREELFIACRLFAGCIFCDHRKALGCEVFFIGLHILKSASGGGFTGGCLEFGLLLLSSTSRWVIWYALEHFVKQFTGMMIQSADASASLAAFRAVLSSQCDAEAYLGEDLCFVDPSEKLAHFFQVKSEELRNRCVTEFMSEEDKERLLKVVQSSVEGRCDESAGACGDPQTAQCLTVTLETGNGRKVETQLCLGSGPATLGQGVSHVVALNEVRDIPTTLFAAEGSLDDVIPQDAAHLLPQSIEESEKLDSSVAPAVPLNAETLAFHAWSLDAPSKPCGVVHSVALRIEPSTMEVCDITLSVKSKGNRLAKERRVALRECIVPGVWQDVNDWIAKSLSDGVSQAPAIVPFVFPKMATQVLAARRAELQWVRSPGHTKELLLTLCDIRIRRFQERSLHRAVGRGTRSDVSRESLVSGIPASDGSAHLRPWAPPRASRYL